MFFSLLVAGLSRSPPGALHDGLTGQGVPASAAQAVAGVPPVGLMFAAFLGNNPIASLLASAGVPDQFPDSTVATLTSRTFLPHLLAGPFHDGVVVVFVLAAVLATVGVVVSLFRGGVFSHDEEAGRR